MLRQIMWHINGSLPSTERFVKLSLLCFIGLLGGCWNNIQAFFVIACLSLSHICSCYWVFKTYFQSFHVTLTMLANEGDWCALQLPARAIASTNICVVYCLLSLLIFPILAAALCFISYYTYTCTIATHWQEKQFYASISKDWKCHTTRGGYRGGALKKFCTLRARQNH